MNKGFDENMTENELRAATIQEFVNIQRIKNAENRDKEIEYQERVLRAKLQALGITTENIEI